MNKLKGVFVVMVTPFKENGEIDFVGIEANIESAISNNVQGLLVAGALGEYSSMDIEERKSLTEFVLKKVNGRVPVVVGTTTNRTEWTIELTNHAEECGAVGAMILTPPGSGLMDEEIYQFYNEVTNAISLSVMVYNNPGSSGMDLEFDLLSRIAKLPNVECVKEASGDVKRISRIADELRGEIEPMCGWEDMHYESFCAGAQGWVCMGANFAPNITRDLFTLIDENKDYEAARKLSQKYLPVARYLETAGKVTQTCKHIMEKRGLVGGYCRRPKQPLTIEEKNAIDDLLATVELN
jgi:4-hydroxy-tetrahydrodipicolinate synthase